MSDCIYWASRLGKTRSSALLILDCTQKKFLSFWASQYKKDEDKLEGIHRIATKMIKGLRGLTY